MLSIQPSAITPQNSDDEYETSLTRLAESAVEQGVNEATTVEHVGDGDFGASVKKATSANHVNRAKNRKKKKAQRQNRKKNRK